MSELSGSSWYLQHPPGRSWTGKLRSDPEFFLHAQLGRSWWCGDGLAGGDLQGYYPSGMGDRTEDIRAFLCLLFFLEVPAGVKFFL